MANIKKVSQDIENIIVESLEDIVSERFGNYAKYIIQDRALPDGRDGLKPVQRRILYAMHELGMFHNKPYKKSARIAGEVMGKYHPHGDSSIYEAMVRLSQDFKMRIPLIDMHGNNGSIDGDSAAAMRYTEARLSLASELILRDIDKKTVPFVPNFDDEELEPTVLPTKFPNLLVNGATGISAGYATKIPPHNLGEIIDATILLLNNEDATNKDIFKIVKGPDFPTGGIVQGKSGILEAIEKGSGKIVIRSLTQVEEISKTQERLVITEIPYDINKADLVSKIDQLRIDKKIDDILEVRDETDQSGLRIAIDLKKGSDSQFVLNYLLKNTDMQVTFHYNIVAILNNRPQQVGFKNLLKTYITHQKEVITNRSNYELEKARRRKHIVEGLIKMVSIVDQIIKIIRASNNKSNAKENIMEQFNFSDLQAEAIVTLQLYRLSNTDIMALENEANQLDSKILQLEKILSSDKHLRKVIENELLESKNVLDTNRKTIIEDEIETIKIDEIQLISDELVHVGITKDGYVKRASIRSFQATPQGGLKEDDAMLFSKEVSTLDTLLLFTNLGNYIYLPVYKLEDQKWKDLGIYINNIIEIERDETIVDIMVVSDFEHNKNVMLTTKKGIMKQVKLKDLNVSRFSKPIRAIKLSKNDNLVSVCEDELNNVIVVSKLGYILRYNVEELPLYGLNAAGVKGMSLSDDDEVVEAFYAKDSDDIMLLSIRGHVIKDTVAEIPTYQRARRGVRVIDLLKSNPHYIVSAQRLSVVQQKDDVLVYLIGTKDMLETTASQLKYQQNKYGKKIIDDNMGQGYKLIIFPSYREDMRVKKESKLKKNNTIPSQQTSVKLPVVEKEVISKGREKISISRLDLFDDEE